MDPAPPSGSRAGINWFLAGSVANGLRSQKEALGQRWDKGKTKGTNEPSFCCKGEGLQDRWVMVKNHDFL